MATTPRQDDPQFALDFTQKRPPEVQERIRDGMQRADEHADGQWRHVWDACVVAKARQKATITVDDVLDEMEQVNAARKAAGQPEIDTHNKSAIGPAMTRAFKLGVIKPTNVTVRSTRPEKHGNRHTVWESKLHAGGAPLNFSQGERS